MSFIGDLFDAIVDIVTIIIDIIIQLVEIVIDFIAKLLGFEDQVVEYYEVHNIVMFPDADLHNPLLSSVARSVLTNTDIAGELIYNSAFRSLKGDLRKFMQYIDNGNYFEGFPAIESYITYVDYVELTDALFILNGVPCTPERSAVDALDTPSWIRYWLQENKIYDVGANLLGEGDATVSTSPASTSSTFLRHDQLTLADGVAGDDEVTIGAVVSSDTGTPVASTAARHIQVTITDEVATSDTMIAGQVWQVDFPATVYNELTDDYTVTVYNDNGDERELDYVIPSKPLKLHYISYYYRDSDPGRQYIFVYLVGSGTYPDLDDPENAIGFDGALLNAVPAIPLRISNVNYTARPAAEVTQIEELCDLVSLDAEAVLDSIMNDPDAEPGDIDNVYVNFGIRMWDGSQSGLTYLFNMFENLFPTQGVTQGTYNNTAPGDTKPQNNIIITTGDYKYLFQFSYITFEHFTVPEIDADTGSLENGIYYSDMSRFNDAGDLVYSYYSSSGKGTYNTGYKADDLAEVALFLAGNGVVNPGDTTGEATDWLQTTARMRYTLPLQDADGNASGLLYLTPDMVYENASGVLRLVNSATEATTSGQSITYYFCTPEGLDAYTVKAPIGALKVIDGDTGRFRMVKFNLGAPDDLMVPFIHNFVDVLSNREVTQLFLAGTHASVYIAHYEVIEQSGWGMLLMIVLIIIIIVVAWVFLPEIIALSAGAAPGATVATGITTASTAVYAAPVAVSSTGITTVIATGEVLAIGTVTSSAAITGIVTTATVAGGIAGAFAVAWAPTLLSFAVSFAVNQIVKAAVTALAKDNPELAALLGVIAAVAMGSFSPDTVTFAMPSASNMLRIFGTATDYISQVITIHVENEGDDLRVAQEKWREDFVTREGLLEEVNKGLFRSATGEALSLVDSSIRSSINPMLPEDYFILHDAAMDTQYISYDYEATIDFAVTTPDFT